MKRFIYMTIAALLVAGCTADLEDQRLSSDISAASEKILNSSHNCTKGVVLVYFGASAESRLAESATRSGATRTGVAEVDAVLDAVGGYSVEPVFVETEKNRERLRSRGMHLWYELRFGEECDMEEVAMKLAAVAEVERVQFEGEVCRVGSPKSASRPELVLQQATRTDDVRQIPFNDVWREYQWSLNNLGSNSKVQDAGRAIGLPAPVLGADINLVPAWDYTYGDPSIVVAVMDEGVMYSHEDLSANMWVNSGEVPGDGLDNDGNHYVDDIYGFNFVRGVGEVSWDHDNDSGHGTHVAGIISAVNNNGIGICGIAGGDGTTGGVRIMSTQIFRGSGGASYRNVANSIIYAADNGAHILQCSWGYASNLKDPSGPANDTHYQNVCTVEAAAFDYFIDYGGTDDGPIDGGLIIFAAGNDAVGLPAYPAAYKPCVAVAAASPSMRPTYYTNFGIGTDIVAPGGEAFYTNGSIFSTVPQKFSDPSIQNYGLMQGTSQACPHVSGVAALGLSYAKKLGKRYSVEEFRSMLLSATNDIEPFLVGSITYTGENNATKKLDYPYFKGKLGAGYVDALKLILQIDGTPYTVVKRGVESTIDLAPYFGDGVHRAKLLKIDISDEDKSRVGLVDCTFESGELKVLCENSGVATFSVTLLVGGGSLSDSSLPYPVEVTKRFVVMSKESVQSNGWL